MEISGRDWAACLDKRQVNILLKNNLVRVRMRVRVCVYVKYSKGSDTTRDRIDILSKVRVKLKWLIDWLRAGVE